MYIIHACSANEGKELVAAYSAGGAEDAQSLFSLHITSPRCGVGRIVIKWATNTQTKTNPVLFIRNL